MNQLIRIIGKQLNIPITDGSKSVCRIIYSVAGQIALSSLWDSEEGNNYVSVRHFKKRISDILDAYKSVDPEMRTLMESFMLTLHGSNRVLILSIHGFGVLNVRNLLRIYLKVSAQVVNVTKSILSILSI